MRTRRTPRECCDQTQISGLYLLTAGTGGEAMANRLYSPRLAALFHFLRQDFDAIVIDAPPLSELDSRPLARVADGVVMVIAARQTSPEVLSAGMDRLAADGTNILGTLVNHPEPRGGLVRQLTVKTLPVPENSFETA